MNWQYLTYFEVVAEEQHFTRAAEKLYITTSALSRAISSLEEELNAPLFQKVGRNVQLTEYGETFLSYVKEATRSIDAGCKKIDEMTKNNRGTIYVSVIYTFASTYLSRILRPYTAKYPNVDFKIYQKTTMDTISNVLNGFSDLGFASDYIDQKRYSSLEFTKVVDEEIVLIVPDDHELASKEKVSIHDIANEEFISFDQTSGILYLMENIFSESGYQFKISMTATDDYTVASLVQNGMGIAFIPYGEYVAKSGVTVVHMDDERFRRNIYMLWKKNTTPSYALKNFKNYIMTEIIE